MDETREIDIDLRKIFYMMRTKVVFIILITIFTAIAAGCISHFLIAPTYTATVSFYVHSNADRATTDQTITAGELTASQELVNTYIYMLKSNTVLDKVASDLNLASGSEIAGLVSASPIKDTVNFTVTVQSGDPDFSAKVANSIAKVAPTEIIKIVKAGGIQLIDNAKVPSAPSSPDTKKNILIGAVAGFVVSFAAFFIYEMFDSTITNANDLERDFEIPVLGTIPRLDVVKYETEEASFDNELEPPKPIAKPSNALLENIQSMKGDAKNE